MMGRTPFCDESSGLKKGPWTPEEDKVLVDYIQRHGHGSWRALPNLAGLNRCGKSCRLRWTNYLRPDIKRGKFSEEEEQLIINLHKVLGNKWSAIAGHLPGRTDNEIKNFWNTHLKKKLLQMGLDPVTHRPRSDNYLNLLSNLQQLLAAANNIASSSFTNPYDLNALRLHSDATELAKIHMLQNLLQALSANPNLDPFNFNAFGSSSSSSPLQDHHLYELFGLANHFDSVGFLPSQNQPNFSNFEVPKQPAEACEFQLINGGNSSCREDKRDDDERLSNLLPNLVSASPEWSPVKQIDNKLVNPNEFSNPSSTSTSFEIWGDFMDGEASDDYWKDLIRQESKQPWSIS